MYPITIGSLIILFIVLVVNFFYKKTIKNIELIKKDFRDFQQQRNILRQKLEDERIERYVKRAAQIWLFELEHNKYSLLLLPPYDNGLYTIYHYETAKYKNVLIQKLIQEEFKKIKLEKNNTNPVNTP